MTNKTITVRLTETEDAKLKSDATRKRLTVSEYVRQLIVRARGK